RSEYARGHAGTRAHERADQNSRSASPAPCPGASPRRASGRLSRARKRAARRGKLAPDLPARGGGGDCPRARPWDRPERAPTRAFDPVGRLARPPEHLRAARRDLRCGACPPEGGEPEAKIETRRAP